MNPVSEDPGTVQFTEEIAELSGRSSRYRQIKARFFPKTGSASR